jgi:hypothetical protein
VGSARQWHCKHVSTASNQDATIEELLEAAFYVQSMLRPYSKDQREKLVTQRSNLAVSSHELQVSSGSSLLAVRNLHC